MKHYATFSLVAASAIWLAGCGNADMTFREVPGEKAGGAGSETAPDGSSADQTAVNPAGGQAEEANGSGAGPTQVVVEGETPEQTTVISVDVDAGSAGVAGQSNGETISEGGDTIPGPDEGSSADSEGSDVAAGSGDEETESSSGHDGSTSKDHNHKSDDAGSAGDKGMCAAKHDASAEKIRVVGSERMIVLKGDEVLMIRVTGNKSSVKISSQATEGASAVRGICIFAAGNQAAVSADLKINVGSFAYFGTGNQSKGHVTVGEGYEMSGMSVILRGNQASLKVDGEGKFECGTPDLKGNGPMFECKK